MSPPEKCRHCGTSLWSGFSDNCPGCGFHPWTVCDWEHCGKERTGDHQPAKKTAEKTAETTPDAQPDETIPDAQPVKGTPVAQTTKPIQIPKPVKRATE